MKIISDRHEVVYKNENNGKIYYSIKLAKKDEQGNWVNGYINCRFKKDVILKEPKTHIEIKDAWLDFYIKDKITNVYIFINDFEITDSQKNEVNEDKIDPFADFGKQIDISDEDLPF